MTIKLYIVIDHPF